MIISFVLEKKYLKRDDAVYLEEACDGLTDNLADYMGRLSREQKSEACAVLAGLQRADTAWLAERERWVDWLETTLARSGDWQAELRNGVAGWAETVPDTYRELYSHNSALIYRAVAQTVDGRSERQDQRLRRKLASLREDASRLSAG